MKGTYNENRGKNVNFHFLYPYTLIFGGNTVVDMSLSRIVTS